MLFKVKIDFTCNGVLEIDAADEHSANEEVGRLETALLDEVNNWGLTEIRELRMCSTTSPAQQH